MSRGCGNRVNFPSAQNHPHSGNNGLDTKIKDLRIHLATFVERGKIFLGQILKGLDRCRVETG